MNATPNRRRLLLGAVTAGAAAAVAAVPAMVAPAQADPVLVLIEAHKAAWARLLGTEARTNDHKALAAAARAVDVALEELTTTPPTTAAGIRAVIEYMVELDGHSDYLPTLLRSSILRAPVLAG